MRLRIGTFNVENLFARFKFDPKLKAPELDQVIRDGWSVDRMRFVEFDPVARRITADAVSGLNADVLALQEVEGLDTLKRFNSQFLKDLDYRYQLLIDGNDQRLIDVAVLSRFPFAYVQTHQYDRTAHGEFLFSRDCLEVGVLLPSGAVFTVFVNHLKSMIGGRDQTMARRRIQSNRAVEILESKYGGDPGAADWAVVGDFNDYLPSTGISPLVEAPWAVNVVARLPADDQWTHYYKGGNEYRQLDYVLLSRKVAQANPDALPIIERRGMPLRATRYAGPRFEHVGQDAPKASDHCPVAIDLDV